MIDNAVIIQYPAGGFGHFMYGLLTICTDVFHKKQTDFVFSNTGDSHSLDTNTLVWSKYNQLYSFTPASWANNNTKRHIVLVDHGITSDAFNDIKRTFTNNKIIRMCIDNEARSVINQTCMYKAEAREFTYYSELEWERREQFTKQYHFADANPTYYLNNYQPVTDTNTLNISISRLFSDWDNLVAELGTFLQVNITVTDKARTDFLTANYKYYHAVATSKQILSAVSDGKDLTIPQCSLHDQGYINYCIEKEFKLAEVPPYDYRDWFKSTADIQAMLDKLI